MGGVIRRTLEDFVVDEVPLYECSGEGQHLFLHVEKRERTTEDVMGWLRDEGFREIGMAGRKDRHAVTRQYFSVERRQWNEAMAARAPAGIKVLSTAAHGNKLKLGHLRGNHFDIRIRDAVGGQALADRYVARIAAMGLPNFFGPQRFGRHGDNPLIGRRVLKREVRVPRSKAQFYLSALQSEIFNNLLAERMRLGLWRTVMKGDILKKTETGGMFYAEDPGLEQGRLEGREVVPTGPLFGPEMMAATDDVAVLEQAALAAAGLTDADWAKGQTTGSRRALFIYAADLAAAWEPAPSELAPAAVDAGANLRLSFFLPKGSFATVLLHEIMGVLDGAGE